MEREKTASIQKKAEDHIESDHLQWQQEKTSLLEEMEKSRASCLAQLDEQRHENSKVMVALEDAEQQLAIKHLLSHKQ